MKCTHVGNAILCQGRDTFKCPHCGKEYEDNDERYYKRIDSNKSGWTKETCSCGKIFGIVSDMTGDLVGFDLDK